MGRVEFFAQVHQKPSSQIVWKVGKKIFLLNEIY